jgi:hypothetical protein
VDDGHVRLDVADGLDLTDQRRPGQHAAEQRVVGGDHGRAALGPGAVERDVVGLGGEALAVGGGVPGRPGGAHALEQLGDRLIVGGGHVILPAGLRPPALSVPARMAAVRSWA